MPSFTFTQSVAAPAAALWALAGDPRRAAALFPYVALEEIEEPEPGTTRFRRELAMPNLPPLRWREEDRVTGERELSFRALEGDLRTFAGRWRVSGDAQGSTLELSLDYEVPPAFMQLAPEPLARMVMEETLRSICRRIKEAAEEEAR